MRQLMIGISLGMLLMVGVATAKLFGDGLEWVFHNYGLLGGTCLIMFIVGFVIGVVKADEI